MTIHDRMERLTQKLAAQCRHIDRKSIEAFIKAIINSKKIFIHGAGRSGLAGRAFAMRLMHLGFKVHYVGEVTTPPIHKNDLYLAISGSGRTSSVVILAKTAKSKGAKLVLLTSHPDSPLGALADLKVVIKGRELTKGRSSDYLARQITGTHDVTAPLGTLFELGAMVFFDSVIEELMIRKNKTENELRTLHTNLE
ncbi:6-phospho-3-hexuloisomerase [Candidatus Micrarchaeota archaeon]|nr:MAG: 6-phospho-3-hexuloisomerase [Candidatus Micrarchaeota archaeon]